MELKLHEIFQSGMVLQREKPVRIFGSGVPGSCVTAEIQGQQKKTAVSVDGTFAIQLNPLTASDAEQLTVSDGKNTIQLQDVAVGEVWLAGGQSNMEFWMHFEKHIEEVRPTCENPRVRFYDVPKIAFDGQRELFDYSRMAVWRKADAENIDYFSGVAYFFAAKLERELHVPVGVIGCNWGGTTASVWMRKESVRQVGKIWIKDHEQLIGERDMSAYWEMQRAAAANDTGNPLENKFNNQFLPGTPPVEEAMKFIMNSLQPGDADPEPPLLPASFPGTLYEHMLKTLEGCVFRGVLWYQGESDEPHADLYGVMLTRLIQDWRALFQDPALPFLLVQLPGYDSWFGFPQMYYRELRRQQKAVADGVDQVYLTSISDAGEKMDIHPKDKKTPGERLCLLALGKVYGKELLCEAPEPDELKREGKRILIHFKNAEGGLHLEGENLNVLIVESDQTYSVQLDGESLILEFEEEPKPYLWIRHAVQQFYIVNLYNKSGIPAIPFEVRV